MALLERRFKDPRLLAVFAKIIHGFTTAPGKGLPIGSLTSQHFANYYLGWLDRFVKETLRIRGYVRYMDDVGIWTATHDVARSSLAAIRQYVSLELCLELKPEPYINRTEHGMDFLGCRIHRTHYSLNRAARIRFRRKLTRLFAEHQTMGIGDSQLQAKLTSLTAFARAGHIRSWRFRSRSVSSLSESGHEALPG